MSNYVYAWHPNSQGAAGLAKGLGIRRIRHEDSRFQGGPRHTVINWGAAQPPQSVLVSTVVNNPQAIARCANKLTFFQTMSASQNAPRLPEWTSDAAEALRWHKAGEQVVARTVLNGHSGKGIVFLSEANDLGKALNAPLFTKYKKKLEEFRIHIIRGRVVDQQKKLLRQTDDNGQPIDKDKIDFRVRNLANGFIFARNDIDVHPDVVTQAQRAMAASGLDFGAVDVIWNDHEGKAYVLEINTAPGLQGTTLDNYVAAFKEIL